MPVSPDATHTKEALTALCGDDRAWVAGILVAEDPAFVRGMATLARAYFVALHDTEFDIVARYAAMIEALDAFGAGFINARHMHCKVQTLRADNVSSLSALCLMRCTIAVVARISEWDGAGPLAWRTLAAFTPDNAQVRVTDWRRRFERIVDPHKPLTIRRSRQDRERKYSTPPRRTTPSASSIRTKARRLLPKVFQKAGGVCHWCQKPLTMGNATIEHLLPISQGGGNDMANLSIACRGCNR